ncbi:MAG: lipopolysaccharide heptosyltransferase II, partial [Vicinamibacteria bacterium]|nr:lipopolysaccharide heptosyltransferase II [Vicinamibacteria bacterium]
LACPADWSERAAERLAAPGPWVVINPGAAYGSAKRWLPARFAAVGDGLAESHGARIAIVGSAKEREIGMAVAAQMRAPALVLSGETSLHELIGVLNRARLLVTNDSGPMHLAAALGRAVVAIFGPTDPSETAPVGARARIVRETAECAPCRHRECPTDHRCMERVTGERVLALARQMLE